ncbi:MAG: protein rep, partial [Saprospiraceae bacterium]|nr:protein rep [Saprospiraceae bacterium]
MGKGNAASLQEGIYTLAQSGTAGFDTQLPLAGKIVYGAGVDLNDKVAWKAKAKRKNVTRVVILSLIEAAKKKGATDRVKAYRNTLYCMDKICSSNGRVYGRYCKNRFCTLCCSIRKADIINRYYPEIVKWEDLHFVTLTEKAVPAAKLDLWFYGVQRAFRLILNKYKKRNQRGMGIKLMGVKSLECNFNPVKRTYNPHLHLIVPNAEIAKTLVTEWQKLWNRGQKTLASPLAQHIRRVENVERDLVELIKYGSKIFTEPDMNKSTKNKIPRMVYAAALDNIFAAMKPYRLFERFGFNLPPQSKQSVHP